MRFFTAVAAFGLIALASAQTTQNATEVASSTSEAAPATTTAAVTLCLSACAGADICCQAACVGVPCPSDLQANQTTECAAQCVQGNGTEEETASYAACQASCVSSLFLSSSAAGGAGATGSGTGAGDATATATGDAGTGTGIGDGSASATGASADASATSDSGNGAVRNTVAGVGLLALVVAGLAL